VRAAPVVVCLFLLGLGARVAGADGIRDRLLASDPVEVYKAITDVGGSKDVKVADALLEAGVKAGYPHLAVACGDTLRALGPEAEAQPDFRKVLQKALKSKDVRDLANLARVLGAYAHVAFDEPLSFLASGRRPPEVQAEALYAIGGLTVSPTSPFSRCVQAVRDAILDKTPSVQLAACSAAGRLRVKDLVPQLEDAVRQSQNAYAGLFAVWALTLIGADVSLSAYLRVIGSDAKRETMQACLKAVTNLSGPEDVDELLSVTRSPRKDARDAACIALGLVCERRGVAKEGAAGTTTDRPPVPVAVATKIADRMVTIIATDGDWEVRDAARTALLRVGDVARAAVVREMPRLLDASDRDASLTAIELCGLYGVQEAYRDLAKLAVYDGDPVRRMFAARALSGVNPQLGAEELTAAAARDKKGKDTTIAAIRALGYIRHEAAYKGALSLLSGGDLSEKVSAEVERTLERMTRRRFGTRLDRWDSWWAKAKDHDPFGHHLPKHDRGANRREVAGRHLYGVTDTTERAVESGLRWLELQQHVEGLWDGNDKGFGGVTNCQPAYTGLSLLAFLGAGYESGKGKYRETIRRSAEFLAATQFYDGGFPVTGGGDNSWIFAYLISMGIWGINETLALHDAPELREPAQRGIDYLVRTQEPGGGWRYGPRNQSDSSCTAWVLMTLKTASLIGLRIAPKSFDGIDSWLERCQSDMTGEEEKPEDISADFAKEVGVKRSFKAITGYFVLSGSEKSALQQTSMTAVGMVSRAFLGWSRSHPFQIGSANYLMDYLPQWRKGLEKGQAIAWYFYYWYYATLAMHQMGGRYWRAWNEKIKTMLPENQRVDPPALAGSWDPDTAVLNGGRLFSTSLAIMTLETYYRFSPLVANADADTAPAAPGKPGPAMAEPGMDDPAMGDAARGEPAMEGAPGMGG